MKPVLNIILIFFYVICFTVCSSSFATIRTWNGGGGNNNWTTAANWGGTAPVAGDDLVFGGAVRTSPSNDFAAGTSFASISFSVGASAFTVSGNSVIISGGGTAITASNTSLTMTISLNITFSTSAPTISIASGGTLTLSGTINNGGLQITNASVGSSNFSGVISGAGALTKAGNGTLTLSGANTFTGGVTLSAGQLNINNATALGAAAGTFTISAVTTIDNTTAGALTISANNPMTWTSDFTFTGTQPLNLGTGAVNMGASVRSVTTTASTLTVGGTINGTGGLTKSGAGTMALGNINATNWTGTTTINAGTLSLGNPGGDNYKSLVWVINNGGTLKYSVSNVVDNNAVMTVNIGGIIDFNNQADAIGDLAGGGSIVNIGGNIYLTKPAAGNGSDFSGVASGTGNLNAGNGAYNTQILSGLNTYTGKTTIEQGIYSINTLKNVGGGASSLGAPTTVANGTIDMGSNGNTGIFIYTGTATATNRIINLTGTTGGATIDQSGTGLLNFTSAFTATGVGAKTLTLQGSTAGTGQLSGAIVDGVGTTSLSKAGSGTWTLSGANTYTGTTTVSAGTLVLGSLGAIPSTSNFIAAGGILSSGAGAGFNATTSGTLTLTGNTTLALGTGSHSLHFGASNGTAWTAGQSLTITGWQGSYNCTGGTSGKIFTGASTELSAAKLAQISFVNPGDGLTYGACQLGTGEIVASSIVLPITLISFKVEKVKSTNELHWLTANETNSNYFEVLRSSDGINFESIGKVKAAGNTASYSTYVFVDDAPLNGVNYYKLTQYDFDGAHATSVIIAINNKAETVFKINALYPNPASSSVFVNFESEAAGNYYANIYDELGKELTTVMIEGVIGKNQFILPVDSYSNGKYFVRIISPKKESIVSQIILQH